MKCVTSFKKYLLAILHVVCCLTGLNLFIPNVKHSIILAREQKLDTDLHFWQIFECDNFCHHQMSLCAKPWCSWSLIYTKRKKLWFHPLYFLCPAENFYKHLHTDDDGFFKSDSDGKLEDFKNYCVNIKCLSFNS